MAFRLARLPSADQLVDEERRPSSFFQRWWQTMVETIEDTIRQIQQMLATITQILIDVGIAQSTADNGLELAQSAILPGGTIKDDKVVTASMTASAATDPWRVSSTSVITFAAATKTQILSVTVTKAEDDSYLELSCQIPFEGADAIDIDIGFEAQQAGVAVQTIANYRIQLDANAATKLPWAFVDEFDALDAGTYDIKIFGTRFSANGCSTVGRYKMRVRDFKR